jgi:hypothetical protein
MKLGVVDIKQVISESSEDLEEKMTSRFRSFDLLVHQWVRELTHG